MSPNTLIGCLMLLFSAASIPTNDSEVIIARLLATSKQMANWSAIMDHLPDRLSNAQSSADLINVTAQIAGTIEDRYPYTLHSFHQQQITGCYKAAICYHALEQHSLIVIMRLMNHQNRKLNIDSCVSTWNDFFFVYYNLKNLVSDESKAVPTVETFEIIIRGIVSQVRSAGHSRIVDRVYAEMDCSYNLIPSELICQLRFKVYAENGHTALLVHLLLSHSDIVFYNANIKTFNIIIQSLGDNVAIAEVGLFEFALLTIVNLIMPRHPCCAFNMDSYSICARKSCNTIAGTSRCFASSTDFGDLT